MRKNKTQEYLSKEEQQFAWNFRLLLEGSRPDGTTADRISNKQMASDFGVTNQQLGRWKNGIQTIPKEVRKDIVKYFGVTDADMYDDWFSKKDRTPTVVGIFETYHDRKPKNKCGETIVYSKRQLAFVSSGNFYFSEGTILIVDPLPIPDKICVAGDEGKIFTGLFVDSGDNIITLNDGKQKKVFNRSEIAGRCIETRLKVE